MFNKIDVTMFKEYMTKYPNGNTIFESLSKTISSYNTAVDEVNASVASGLTAIDAAYTTLHGQVTALFSNLETEYNADFTALQNQVNLSLADKATQVQVDAISAQLADIEQKVDVTIPAQLNDIEQDKAEKTDVGLLSGLLTTAKTSIVNAINELFNNKANKTQPEWINASLLNGVAGVFRYRKNDFGIVFFEYEITVPAIAAYTQVVNLPIGYRPKYALLNHAFNQNTFGDTRFVVLSAGVFYPLSTLTSGHVLKGGGSYYGN